MVLEYFDRRVDCFGLFTLIVIRKSISRVNKTQKRKYYGRPEKTEDLTGKTQGYCPYRPGVQENSWLVCSRQIQGKDLF